MYWLLEPIDLFLNMFISETDDESHSIGVIDKTKNAVMSWMCGVSEETEYDEVAIKQAEAREAHISDLNQDPHAIIVLRILLCIMLSIGVFIYCFWSLCMYVCFYFLYSGRYVIHFPVKYLQ